jgi:hypothetical protein
MLSATILGPTLLSGVRCPSDVTIEVLCMNAECNHILGPTLAGVRCLSDVTIEVLRMNAERNHILGPTLDSEWRNHI